MEKLTPKQELIRDDIVSAMNAGEEINIELTFVGTEAFKAYPQKELKKFVPLHYNVDDLSFVGRLFTKGTIEDRQIMLETDETIPVAAIHSVQINKTYKDQ